MTTLVMDTYYVESSNNVLDVYLDKHIVYDEASHQCRTNQAISQWTENIDRLHTSL